MRHRQGARIRKEQVKEILNHFNAFRLARHKETCPRDLKELAQVEMKPVTASFPKQMRSQGAEKNANTSRF